MNMDINEKEIEKASRKIDLSGFKMQDNLNPKIWDKDQKMNKTLPEVAFLPISLLTTIGTDGAVAMLDGAASAVSLLESRGLDVVVYLERTQNESERINAILTRMGSVRIMNATPIEMAETGAIIATSDKDVRDSLAGTAATVIFAETATRATYSDLLTQFEALLGE